MQQTFYGSALRSGYGPLTTLFDAGNVIDRAVAFLRERGFEPLLLLETWEEALFRRRFPISTLGTLDWPPAAEIAARVRIYRLGDREKDRAGVQAPTAYVR